MSEPINDILPTFVALNIIGGAEKKSDKEPVRTPIVFNFWTAVAVTLFIMSFNY